MSLAISTGTHNAIKMNPQLIKKIGFGFFLCCSLSFAEPRLRPAHWAQPVLGTGLENVYQVDKQLYRSEQPELAQFQALAKLGVQEVLNLREYHSDQHEAEGLPFTLHELNLAAGSVTPEQLLEALRIIHRQKGGLLVHCWHGSDRTGVVIAAYRLVMQNWTKAQAIDEMLNGGYGYHSNIYPNLVQLLENLDVAALKIALMQPADHAKDGT